MFEIKLVDMLKKKKNNSVVPSISKGQMTLKLPLTMFRENRERLVQELRRLNPRALVLIKAANSVSCQSKINHPQDPKFFWAFGCQNTAAIGAIDVASGKSFLIIPRLSECDLDCCEKQEVRSELRNRYMVNGVCYLEELEYSLQYIMLTNCNEILILDYQKLQLPAYIFKYQLVPGLLGNVMHNLMDHKTEKEIKVLSYISKHLNGALIHIIHRFRPGMTDEQMESWFCFFMTNRGGFDQLTFCISSSDDALHCKPHVSRSFHSRRERVFKEGELCIIEAGASYFGHRMSLGIVIPVSEDFNMFQKIAYEAMLSVRLRLCNVLRAGLPVEYLRAAAEVALVKFLVDSKVVCGTVEGAVREGVGALLMPFRLVKAEGASCEDPEVLELGKQYSIQHGCCFNKRLLGEAYRHQVLKKYLSIELRKFEGISVRLSDPVIITADSFVFLSDMPRSRHSIIEMRSRDKSKISHSTIKIEKRNLMVTPSFYTL